MRGFRLHRSSQNPRHFVTQYTSLILQFQQNQMKVCLLFDERLRVSGDEEYEDEKRDDKNNGEYKRHKKLRGWRKKDESQTMTV